MRNRHLTSDSHHTFATFAGRHRSWLGRTPTSLTAAMALVALLCWLAGGASIASAQTAGQTRSAAKSATAGKADQPAGAARTGASAKAPATRPAAEVAKEEKEAKQREELAAISRKLTTDATAALDAGKLDAAGKAIDEASELLTGYVQKAGVEPWHRSVAPIYQLQERKRIALAQKLKASGRKDVTVPTRPKIPPAIIKELAETRKNLQQVTGMITRGDLEQAKKVIGESSLAISKATSESGAPVWHEVIAPAFQVLDVQLTAFNEETKALKEKVLAEGDDAGSEHIRIKVGDRAPAFTATTVDGKPLASKTFTGKWVLLDFWATWCGPCRAELPNMRAVFDAYGKDSRFVMISLSIDDAIRTPREFVAQNDMKWIQGFLGKGWKAPLLKEYGISGIPAVILVDPMGRVAAKGLWGERIKEVVGQVLDQKPGA